MNVIIHLSSLARRYVTGQLGAVAVEYAFLAAFIAIVAAVGMVLVGPELQEFFIDTGAFLARYIERDQHHSTAQLAWRELGASRQKAFTSNFVVDETLTLLARGVSYAFAADRAAYIWASDALTILRPSEADELAGLDLFRKYADQKVSFTDCISFALMKRERLRRAFTFDRHFQTAGFEVWPDG